MTIFGKQFCRLFVGMLLVLVMFPATVDAQQSFQCPEADVLVDAETYRQFSTDDHRHPVRVFHETGKSFVSRDGIIYFEPLVQLLQAENELIHAAGEDGQVFLFLKVNYNQELGERFAKRAIMQQFSPGVPQIDGAVEFQIVGPRNSLCPLPIRRYWLKSSRRHFQHLVATGESLSVEERSVVSATFHLPTPEDASRFVDDLNAGRDQLVFSYELQNSESEHVSLSIALAMDRATLGQQIGKLEERLNEKIAKLEKNLTEKISDSVRVDACFLHFLFPKAGRGAKVVYGYDLGRSDDLAALIDFRTNYGCMGYPKPYVALSRHGSKSQPSDGRSWVLRMYGVHPSCDTISAQVMFVDGYGVETLHTRSTSRYTPLLIAKDANTGKPRVGGDCRR